jgi:DNA sulfur modification protein DndC
MTNLNVEDSVSPMTLADKVNSVLADLENEYRASHAYPWIVGFSGGKDSTLVVQLVYEMLLNIAPGDRHRPIHIVANDTLVESPLLIEHLLKMLDRLRRAADALRLPVTVVKTTPTVEQSFWVNLIGRGYPSPSRSFRWCTDRLKIQPTSHYIRSQAASNGHAILLLGVRREESASRAVSVNRYENGQRLNPHNDLAGCLVYRPIVDLSTEEVWEILLQRRPPWGGNHRELVTLYRNALGGECPLVIDQSQAPSCGTASSRFGCWTCTVVVKDRSMEGFIDAGHADLEPLLEFRDWLAQIRNDENLRMAYRRNGSRTYLKNGKLVPGPFTLAARRTILDRLLALQRKVGMPLITEDEVSIITSIWATDAAKPGEASAMAELQMEAD